MFIPEKIEIVLQCSVTFFDKIFYAKQFLILSYFQKNRI
jgi:hypothetical protein